VLTEAEVQRFAQRRGHLPAARPSLDRLRIRLTGGHRSKSVTSSESRPEEVLHLAGRLTGVPPVR